MSVLTSYNSNAQNLIAVHNASASTFYTSLDTAITYAQNGDTIYIPGGNFSLLSTITKRLHLIGVGHNVDSTVATNITQINSPVTLEGSASGGSLIGLNICSSVQFGTSASNQNITNYTISRCKMNYINLGYSHPSSAINNTIAENIIGYIDGITSQSNVLMNNFVGTIYNFSTNSTFKNNVIFGSYSLCSGAVSSCCTAVVGVTNSLFENNIFLNTPGNVTNSIFNNNLFNSVLNISGNIGVNNIFDQPQNSIFQNQTGNIYNTTHNYHLKPGCPGISAGIDGTDIGIYGGLSWKEGSIPSNPHVQFKNIPNATDANGNLPVNIKVAAQNH